MTLTVTSSNDLQPKGPTEVLDYSVDWSDVMGADTISSGSTTVSAGLTKDSEAHQGQTSTFWVSGGSAGQSYTVTVSVVTVAGRTHTRILTLRVADRTV